jgi:hypothetical protein
LKHPGIGCTQSASGALLRKKRGHSSAKKSARQVTVARSND